MKEQREREREERKKNKIIISDSKKEFGIGSFIYDVCKNVLNSDPHPYPPYLQTSNFGLDSTHSWKSLIDTLYHPQPAISGFCSKT